MKTSAYSVTFNIQGGVVVECFSEATTGTIGKPTAKVKMTQEHKREIFKAVKKYFKTELEDDTQVLKFAKKAKEKLSKKELEVLGSLLKPQDKVQA